MECHNFFQNSSEINMLRTDATLQFMLMKKLNRLAHFRCRKAKESTNEVSLITIYYLNLIIIQNPIILHLTFSDHTHTHSDLNVMTYEDHNSDNSLGFPYSVMKPEH